MYYLQDVFSDMNIFEIFGFVWNVILICVVFI